jgi:hypothetical protein
MSVDLMGELRSSVFASLTGGLLRDQKLISIVSLFRGPSSLTSLEGKVSHLLTRSSACAPRISL